MVFIFLSMLLYTVAIILGTIASRNVNTNLVSAIMSSISAIIPIAVAAPFFSKSLAGNNKVGILAAILGGVAIAIFTLTLNKSYSENKVAIVVPIVFGGSILLSGILSTIFFKEKITITEGIGLGFMTIALALITYARFTGK